MENLSQHLPPPRVCALRKLEAGTRGSGLRLRGSVGSVSERVCSLPGQCPPMKLYVNESHMRCYIKPVPSALTAPVRDSIRVTVGGPGMFILGAGHLRFTHSLCIYIWMVWGYFRKS